MFYEMGVYTMTTTGELYAIVEELELVDIGDAATYLGEEGAEEEEAATYEGKGLFSGHDTMDFAANELRSIYHQ
jgi:hypothetical protein